MYDTFKKIRKAFPSVWTSFQWKSSHDNMAWQANGTYRQIRKSQPFPWQTQNLNYLWLGELSNEIQISPGPLAGVLVLVNSSHNDPGKPYLHIIIFSSNSNLSKDIL